MPAMAININFYCVYSYCVAGNSATYLTEKDGQYYLTIKKGINIISKSTPKLPDRFTV